jgi:methylenetetrahydrofolate dehydrogenase (NADP+)/methenyltetrahydrofolate cyclohydrolase
MMTLVIDGKAVGAEARAAVAADVAERVRRGMPAPGLATILVGDDPASAIYVAAKRRACAEAGIESLHHELRADVSPHEVLALIDRLNDDDAVSGILCQLPLPPHLRSDEIVNRISPDKDVDGLTVVSAGRLASGMSGLRPCTPAGVMLLLAHADVPLAGARAVVIGRSNLFGKPMVQLLLAANATVTICHSATVDPAGVCRSADVVIAAVGSAGLVRRDWIKNGAVIIDVGINRTPAGLTGDVAFDEVAPLASVITPVPGGVGPMTIACLLRNTLTAAEAASPTPVAVATAAQS